MKMATKTTNYGLEKPDGTDFYDVDVQNSNMDIIDKQMKANANAITQLNSDLNNRIEFTITSIDSKYAFTGNSYKHNGKIHRSWDEALFIEENNGYAVFGNYKTLVTEADGRVWKTKEPAIMYFSKDNWFNIIGQLKDNGIYYYCNIASPYVIEERTIKYIDYDLDLRVFPDGSFKVLDRGEYSYHKRIMNYSKDIDIILKDELTILINKVRNKEFPFNSDMIKKYYLEYKKLQKVSNK